MARQSWGTPQAGSLPPTLGFPGQMSAHADELQESLPWVEQVRVPDVIVVTHHVHPKRQNGIWGKPVDHNRTGFHRQRDAN